jgi:YidC/Oxa1 family membrane protein insertase
MIGFAPWQGLLDGLGWVLAQIYELIPNYGVTIIVLTIVIRLVLLPLGIRQVRSMQHMQIIQPKVKQIQTKYKGNKQRQQEEIMKLYREYGVNPFSGCWPVLLQFPILIAMYSVVRFPQHPIHVPEDTQLYERVVEQIPPLESLSVTEGMTPTQVRALLPDEARDPSGTSFLGMNLLCSATQAGSGDAKLGDRFSVNGEAIDVEYPVDCGDSVPDRIPYYVFAVLMFGTTFYQQRQMQKASPPGAASQQQQALLKIMPLMFGVFGIFFPAGLVVYWTTSNAWQIGQQYFMLRSRPTAETLAAKASTRAKDGEPKKGFMASMMERAEAERDRRGAAATPSKAARKPGGSSKPSAGPSRSTTKKGGGSGGGDPKKRPKR